MTWIKSSFSGSQGNCLEVRQAGGWIEIHDSERPDEVVCCTRESLAAFIAGVKAGEFDQLISECAEGDPMVRALAESMNAEDTSGIVMRVPRGWIS
jgi:hypothetical protein